MTPLLRQDSLWQLLKQYVCDSKCYDEIPLIRAASQDDVCDSDLDAEEEVDQEVELGGQSAAYVFCCNLWTF